MTDTMLLLSCMKCKRITLGYAAEVLGISRKTLWEKMKKAPQRPFPERHEALYH